jgi:glycerol-3-phosphate O-acyltransferase / dihydroxyacetone phosphate acyltransferase
MDYRNIRKSKGWIYNMLLPAIHLEYRMLFRKIYLHNRKGVPANKPVLIASNHPTAFIDPIFFCIFFDPPVYNMTRGDIFRKPFFRKLLEHCNMFPVYRQRDGYDRRDRNDEVFEYCKQKLQEGVAVNIFVEGEHHLDKRVLTMQKGIARIAFGTYEQHPMDDLQIVPVGCNYVAGDILRDEAKLNVGKPIFVKDYWQRYQENPGGTVTALCNDIRKALIALCYHIEDRDDDVLAEQLLTLWRNDNPTQLLPIVEKSNDRFLGEKKVLAAINAMSPDEKAPLKLQTTAYFEALNNAGFTDEALTQPRQGHWNWLLLFVLGFIPSILGSILSWPIRALAQYITRKKVSKREFRTSILLGVGTLGTFFYYILLFLVGICLGWPILVSTAILLPVFTWFSIFWNERLTHWRNARRAMQHPDRDKLKAMRAAIIW